MSAIGPSDHEEFCRRDEWQETGGKGHDKWEKRLEDNRLLRTVIQRHRDEYGKNLKSKVLSQLDVDEPTFWQVVQTGEPAARPTPIPEPASEALPDWIVVTLQRGRLNEAEITSLSADEADHLKVVYFNTPKETPPGEVRQRLLDELDTFRRRELDDS